MESMRRMRRGEAGDKGVKVACDVLRTLLVLGGTGWEDELLDGLAALAAVQGDPESAASSREVESAMNLLREKGLVECRKGRRAASMGTSTVKDNLYSLRDYTATMQAFGADRSVLLLRRRE